MEAVSYILNILAGAVMIPHLCIAIVAFMPALILTVAPLSYMAYMITQELDI